MKEWVEAAKGAMNDWKNVVSDISGPDKKIKIFQSLTPEDVKWMEETYGPENVEAYIEEMSRRLGNA